jgi:hypothetical protein
MDALGVIWEIIVKDTGVIGALLLTALVFMSWLFLRERRDHSVNNDRFIKLFEKSIESDTHLREVLSEIKGILSK